MELPPKKSSKKSPKPERKKTKTTKPSKKESKQKPETPRKAGSRKGSKASHKRETRSPRLTADELCTNSSGEAKITNTVQSLPVNFLSNQIGIEQRSPRLSTQTELTTSADETEFPNPPLIPFKPNVNYRAEKSRKFIDPFTIAGTRPKFYRNRDDDIFSPYFGHPSSRTSSDHSSMSPLSPRLSNPLSPRLRISPRVKSEMSPGITRSGSIEDYPPISLQQLGPVNLSERIEAEDFGHAGSGSTSEEPAQVPMSPRLKIPTLVPLNTMTLSHSTSDVHNDLGPSHNDSHVGRQRQNHLMSPMSLSSDPAASTPLVPLPPVTTHSMRPRFENNPLSQSSDSSNSDQIQAWDLISHRRAQNLNVSLLSPQPIYKNILSSTNTMTKSSTSTDQRPIDFRNVETKSRSSSHPPKLQASFIRPRANVRSRSSSSSGAGTFATKLNQKQNRLTSYSEATTESNEIMNKWVQHGYGEPMPIRRLSHADTPPGLPIVTIKPTRPKTSSKFCESGEEDDPQNTEGHPSSNLLSEQTSLEKSECWVPKAHENLLLQGGNIALVGSIEFNTRIPISPLLLPPQKSDESIWSGRQDSSSL